MLFWNGNDYQNDKFIYNYFIQNVFFYQLCAVKLRPSGRRYKAQTA